MSDRFEDKVVLVTGSSSGIGEGIATYLASLGANLVITGRNEERIRKVADDCQERSPFSYTPLQVAADITKDYECKRLIDATIQRYHRLDVLVNNAGMAKRCEITSSEIINVYDEIFRINVRALMVLSHLASEHLIRSKGCIVNISSISGLCPAKNGSIYCASKCAVDMITRCLALDLGPKGVRINGVNPSLIKSPIFETLGMNAEEVYKLCKEKYPLQRVGETIDVAKLVAFLASDDAAYVTGATVNVDGGCFVGRV